MTSLHAVRRFRKGSRALPVAIVLALISLVAMGIRPAFAADNFNVTLDLRVNCTGFNGGVGARLYHDSTDETTQYRVKVSAVVDGTNLGTRPSDGITAVGGSTTSYFGLWGDEFFPETVDSTKGTISWTVEVNTGTGESPVWEPLSSANGSESYDCTPADTDADNDGVPDSSDKCPGTPAGASVNADGCSASQRDSDNDGVNDDKDKCANTPAGTTVDADGCPVVTPPADSDNDGLTDAQEAIIGTDPNKADTDGDGLKDGVEVNETKTDPLKADSDKDGLNDGDEVSGVKNVDYDKQPTNPLDSDSDNDGLSDGVEVNETGTNPNKADTDGDGYSDGDEVKAGTNPLDPKSHPKKDDPAGNNGTIKIDAVAFDDHPNNEPHVGCTFQVDFYGFDQGVGNATVGFDLQSPTADGRTLTVTSGDLTPDIGEDAAGGGTDLDASETYTLKFTGAPHPKQGYHVKLTVNAPGSKGNDVKHKVFWVTGCGDTTEAPNEFHTGAMACDNTTTPVPTGSIVNTMTNTDDETNKAIDLTVHTKNDQGLVLETDTATVLDGESYYHEVTGLPVGTYTVVFMSGQTVLKTLTVEVAACDTTTDIKPVVVVSVKCGVVKSINPNDVAVNFAYGSFSNAEPDGTTVIMPGMAVEIPTTRTSFDWVAYVSSSGEPAGSGSITVKQNCMTPGHPKPPAPPQVPDNPKHPRPPFKPHTPPTVTVVDLCVNMNGVQTDIPAGYYRTLKGGKCYPIVSGQAPHTGGDSAPEQGGYIPLGLAGFSGLAALGLVSLMLRRKLKPVKG